MRVLMIIFIVLQQSFFLFSQPIMVAKNNRFLQTPDGKPFFWLGDTAWELFHRLDREETERYLQNRAEKGFNVIQAVVLPELEGFERANAYGDFPLRDGDITKLDTTTGNDPSNAHEYDHWDHVEWIIKRAADNHLIIGVLPCWGEYVTPRFRERTIQTPQQGYDYGWFIGSRLKHLNDHIIWILGGDRLPDERENGVESWRAMAEGITDAINGEKKYDQKANYYKTFMTYHCYRSSSTWFHHDDWIDMHTWGSYHEQRDNERAYFEAYHDWNLPDPKPTLNSEPAYELLPINYHWKDAALGYFDDFDVRQIAYWSVFSGTCGHTYGCHPVWQMYKKENPIPPLTNTVPKQWFEALDEPGAFHLAHLKNLMLSRPFFSRVPNQQLIVENPYDPTGYLTACSGDGYIFVYIPTGEIVKIKTNLLNANIINVWWFNPRTGEAILEGEMENQAIIEFDPPGERMRGNDWVLVIDDAGKTVVSIKGSVFYINEKITYTGREWQGRKIEGLLFNSRMVQGIFDDLNPETRKLFKYPDTDAWDPDRNTDEFVAAMDDWYAHGLLAFTLNLQGGSPTGYGNKEWINSTFDENGNLRPAYVTRLEKILNRADELGMVVILGYFYFGQDQHLENEAAVIKAVDNATKWILDKGYKNILVEINNETNIEYDHEILQPHRVHELIERVKNISKDGRRLLVTTSYGGGFIPLPNVVQTADFLLIHGNGVNDPSQITEMVELTRQVEGYTPKPILFNEDDHYNFEAENNNLVSAIKSYASWGFFDYRREGEGFEQGFQSVPVDWRISSDRKKAFFNKINEIIGQ